MIRNVMRNIGGGALGISAALGRSAAGRGMMAGGAIGGMYGGISRDTSVIGGMVGGATMGFAGGLGIRTGRAAMGAALGGRGVGQAMRLSATRDVARFARNARASGRFIGRGITNMKAYGQIRGLFT